MSATEIQPARAHAKDMTDDERTAWRQWAYEVEARVANAIGTGREAYWQMAEALYEFEDDGGWKALGHDSLNDWLGQPSIGLARSTYYDAIGAWKALVVERKIAPHRIRALEPTKVAVVLPAIKSGTKLTKEALDDAEALSRSDLRDSYRSPKPKHAELSGQPDSSANVVQVGGQTGDEKVASNGQPSSGQVPDDESEHDEYIRSRTQVLSEQQVAGADWSPSEPPIIEGDAQGVEPENAAEAPGDDATQPDTQGRANQIADAMEAVVQAYYQLPERARTKNVPKPLREAIVNLADLISLAD